jgi:hypothetical protein
MAMVTTEIMIRLAKLLPDHKRGAYSDKCDFELKETSEYQWLASKSVGVNS